MDDFIAIIFLTLDTIVGLTAVAWLAGRRSKQALVQWMNGPEATPYMDMIAERAMKRINPAISAMEGRIKNDLDSRIGTIQLEIQKIKISAIPEFPEPDFDPLVTILRTEMDAAIAGQTASLKAELLESVHASMQGMQSGLNRQLAGQLQAIGIDGAVSELGEAIRDEALASGTPRDMIIAKVMQVNVSRKFAKDNPVAALLIETGKAALMQQVQQMASPGADITNKADTYIVKTSPFG